MTSSKPVGGNLIAFADQNLATVPSNGARKVCSIFMASMTTSGSPRRTQAPGATGQV